MLPACIFQPVRDCLSTASAEKVVERLRHQIWKQLHRVHPSDDVEGFVPSPIGEEKRHCTVGKVVVAVRYRGVSFCETESLQERMELCLLTCRGDSAHTDSDLEDLIGLHGEYPSNKLCRDPRKDC